MGVDSKAIVEHSLFSVLVAMVTCYWLAGEELKSTFVWLGGFVPD